MLTSYRDICDLEQVQAGIKPIHECLSPAHSSIYFDVKYCL